MCEKFVQVTVNVDTTDPEQLSALYSFLSKVGKGNRTEKPDEPTPEVAPKKKSSKSSPTKEVPAEATQPVEESEPELPGMEANQPDPATPSKEYKIEEVRERLKAKVSDHREEIKAKLTELGAPNVSSLDPAKYSDFVGFLESLE